MIRKATDLKNMSDEEFESNIMPFDKMIKAYLIDFAKEYIAFYISNAYQYNALWDEKFSLTIVSALERLVELDIEDIDLNEIKKILEEKYDLKITCEFPLKIEDIMK